MNKLERPDAFTSTGAGNWRRIILSQLRANEGRMVFSRLSAWEAGLLRQMEADGLIEPVAAMQRPIAIRLKAEA